jgi:hypothetical protein
MPTKQAQGPEFKSQSCKNKLMIIIPQRENLAYDMPKSFL